MINLFVYPELFGLPSNNPFDLKVDTFFRLNNIDYKLKNTLDTSLAPRGQLPYIEDDGKRIGDSNVIIAYINKKYDCNFDASLTDLEQNTTFILTRMLDCHLYWVMSYSRWQDERYYPLFRDEFLKNFPDFSEKEFEVPRNINIEKYNKQGIGRYSKEEIYKSGTDDLSAISVLLDDKTYLFGDNISILDANCYAYLANIYYFDIETPLKEYLLSTNNLADYLMRIRSALDY